MYNLDRQIIYFTEFQSPLFIYTLIYRNNVLYLRKQIKHIKIQRYITSLINSGIIVELHCYTILIFKMKS